MRACQNCKRMWDDNYRGQCTDCGAPMGGWEKSAVDLSTATPQDLDNHLRQAGQRANRDNAFAARAQSARARGAGRVEAGGVPGSTVDVARGYSGDIVQDVIDSAA